MDPILKKAIQTVLRADADRLQLNAKSPEDEYFAYTLINYARAKQESETLVNAFALYQTGLAEVLDQKRRELYSVLDKIPVDLLLDLTVPLRWIVEGQERK